MKDFSVFVVEGDIKRQQSDKNLPEDLAKDISEFDRMRVKRNGMKYYGKSCSVKDVEEAVKFAEPTMKKLL